MAPVDVGNSRSGRLMHPCPRAGALLPRWKGTSTGVRLVLARPHMVDFHSSLTSKVSFLIQRKTTFTLLWVAHIGIVKFH